MQSTLAVIGLGIVVFVSTDIDDLVVLSAFFADHRLRPQSVVVGQYLGIMVLVAIGTVVAVLALAVPSGITALLGVLPVALGVRGLLRMRSGDVGRDTEDEADAAEQRAEARTHSQVVAVAAVTIANGGDNLGVYVPMFAAAPGDVPIYVMVFLVMTGVWCAAAYLLVTNTVGRRIANRWGQLIVPFVLMAVGLHILWGAQELLPSRH